MRCIGWPRSLSPQASPSGHTRDMAKLKAAVTTETTVTTEVKLSPQARRMLLDRLVEHAKLASTVRDIKGTKKKPGRMKRIEGEIADLFKREKQGKALLSGTALEGHRMKHTGGTHKVFDQQGFMKKHGLSQADFDEFTTVEDNEPYLKITHGDSDDE